MSRTWKWILGILGVLVVVGLVVGTVFMWRYRSFYMGARPYQPDSFAPPGFPDAPGAGRGYDEYRRYHMMDEWGGGMPMMGYSQRYVPHAFGPIGFGFMLVGGLFHVLLPLGILALVAYVFYQMGKRTGMAAAPSPRPTRLPDVESLPRRKVARP